MVVAPARRYRLFAMFRKVAMTCADVPVRVWSLRKWHESDLVRDRGPGGGDHRVDADARPDRPPRMPVGTQTVAAASGSSSVVRRAQGAALAPRPDSRRHGACRFRRGREGAAAVPHQGVGRWSGRATALCQSGEIGR